MTLRYAKIKITMESDRNSKDISKSGDKQRFLTATVATTW